MGDELRAVTEVLEGLVRDPAPLYALPEADRIRLLNAAGDVFAPDPEVRRQQIRAKRRRERAERIAADEGPDVVVRAWRLAGDAWEVEVTPL